MLLRHGTWKWKHFSTSVQVRLNSVPCVLQEKHSQRGTAQNSRSFLTFRQVWYVCYYRGMRTHGWTTIYATPFFSKKGSKARNSADGCYLCLLKGLSNVIFSSTVALSNQGFCDAYATDPLFLGKKRKKNKFPAYQCSRCFWKIFSCKGRHW